MKKYPLNTIEKNIECSSTEWKKIKNDILMSAIKEKKQTSPNNIMTQALMFFQTRYAHEVVAESKINDENKYYVFTPYFSNEKMTQDECSFNIKFQYFDFDKLSEQDLFKYKFSFVPKIMSDKEREADWERMKNNFTILKVAEMIKNDDLITCEIIPYSQGKELIEYKNNIVVKANSNEKGLAKDLIDHKINDVISHSESPEEKIQITILKIERPTNIVLTEENLHESGLTEFKNLKELKSSFTKDNKWINYNFELGRFLNEFIKNFSSNNELEFDMDIFSILLEENLDRFLSKLPDDKYKEIQKSLMAENGKSPLINELSIDLKENIWKDIITSFVKNTKNFTSVSKEEVEKEKRFINLIYSPEKINQLKINEERITKAILDKKVSTFLLEKLDPESFAKINALIEE
ncbi:trigger factor-related chaperone [Mycoplasmopsis hyopharyngis]|uniref:trigger factor-related chaperone n=1 Tax=Mycoplasmopsis hyopharyngis TaxID=29558 RepID=UPI0038730ACD